MKHQKYHNKDRSLARAPLKRCAASGCAALIEPPLRCCPRHARSNPGSERSEYHRTNGWFYSSARWRRFRLWFLRRHPICVGCPAPAEQVDHIEPIAQGGAVLDESNCQSLCASCHSKKTRAEQLRVSAATAPREGGGKTCGANRRLPSVQLKKSVRRFWAKGVSSSAHLSQGGQNEAKNGQKVTDMMDGFEASGGAGGGAL